MDKFICKACGYVYSTFKNRLKSRLKRLASERDAQRREEPLKEDAATEGAGHDYVLLRQLMVAVEAEDGLAYRTYLEAIGGGFSRPEAAKRAGITALEGEAFLARLRRRVA